MEARQKRNLLNVVYYTLIAVMISFVVFFLITLGNASMANWERVAYYVLTILLLIVVVYDIFATMRNTHKYIVGFTLYAITLAVIILSLIVMAVNSANGRLLIEITERFARLILFSYLINAFAVLIYCTGEKLIVTKTDRSKK